MTMTTPTGITDEIRCFCDSLVQGEDPVWVGHKRADGAEPENCFENVAMLVRERGGESVLGWIIWEWPGVVLQAEFHSVWRSADGLLTDPTPKKDEERTILFLQDRNAIDDGGIGLGKFLELCDWQEVTEYITVCQQNELTRQADYRQYGGILSDKWDSCLLRRRQAGVAITQRQFRQDLVKQAVLIEAEAVARLSQSNADFEASTSLARHMAARGEFRPAFEVLIRIAEISTQQASEVQGTIVDLFAACSDESMVNEFRRSFSALRY